MSSRRDRLEILAVRGCSHLVVLVLFLECQTSDVEEFGECLAAAAAAVAVVADAAAAVGMAVVASVAAFAFEMAVGSLQRCWRVSVADVGWHRRRYDSHFR